MPHSLSERMQKSKKKHFYFEVISSSQGGLFTRLLSPLITTFKIHMKLMAIPLWTYPICLKFMWLTVLEIKDLQGKMFWIQVLYPYFQEFNICIFG